MKKRIMAFCDSESDYAAYMSHYLKAKEGFPYELHTYTDAGKLIEYEKDSMVDMLLVAESDYTYEVAGLKAGTTFVLNESGTLIEAVKNIDKYQMAENIYRELAAEFASTYQEKQQLMHTLPAKVIGLYSPIKRCLQTSFALTLGQALSENKKVLYLSFEHFAGWNQLLEKNVKGDLAALLYFVEEEDTKFVHYMNAFTLQIGKMYYIPPIYAGQNLLYIKGHEWQKLIEKIATVGGYDYLILDLSDSMQGTFEILKLCNRIFTIVKEDERARGKIEQYEDLLREYELEEVLLKTSKQLLPHFLRLPERIEQYTRGELADFVRELMNQELSEEGNG